MGRLLYEFTLHKKLSLELEFLIEISFLPSLNVQLFTVPEQKQSERFTASLSLSLPTNGFDFISRTSSLFLCFHTPRMFNELWVAGGPAANALKPKFGLFASREQSHAGIQVPEIEVRISAIEKFERDCRLIRKIKPKLRYMYAKIKHLSTAVIFLEGICGILFIFGSSNGAYLLIIHQLIASPILYDF
ncbi:hypothetical protein NC653_005393 [Populus alba x Populus x berolinensis]|uniref:Uncharacterized protein n=1 Tax=Populus alba x Populus x berolinensis TaxID=444605 RepID=A0AAD6RBT5_9ROSI|nr:hypothetical protein NC653_005393 [Populus alba x Populus x berolinensis]